MCTNAPDSVYSFMIAGVIFSEQTERLNHFLYSDCHWNMVAHWLFCLYLSKIFEVILVKEPKVSCMQGRHRTTELHSLDSMAGLFVPVCVALAGLGLTI